MKRVHIIFRQRRQARVVPLDSKSWYLYMRGGQRRILWLRGRDL
jgi:hypothetical protein